MTLTRVLLVATAIAAQAGSLSAQGPRPSADESLADDAITLDVMTFNIRTSAIDDGDDAWRFRKELVAETIARVNAQVLGLQEALAEQIEFLAEALPQYRWIGVDRGLNGGTGLSEATPIFYRYEEMVPIESGTFWLGNPPNRGGAPTDSRGASTDSRGAPQNGGGARRGGSRIVTWARFHHLATGRQVWVYNTHLSPREGQQHVEAAARINERIAAHPPGSAVVVLGDFNAYGGSSETWRTATSQGLRDAWDLADARHGPDVTSNGFGPPPEWGGARIDWVLVGGPIDVSTVSTVVHSVDGRYPSDHYPVLATLRLRPS
jgi:endonuclease/exonuclease/phosphatase family metal-dependent hydrolase